MFCLCLGILFLYPTFTVSPALFGTRVLADLFPDILGYIFIWLGLRTLREESFEALRRNSLLLILISALLFAAVFLAEMLLVYLWPLHAIVKLLPAFYATRQLVRGVRNMELRYGCDMRAGRLLRLWKRYVAIRLVTMAVAFPPMTIAHPVGGVPGLLEVLEVLAMIGGLCPLVIVIQTFPALRFAGKQLAAVRAGEAAEGTPEIRGVNGYAEWSAPMFHLFLGLLCLYLTVTVSPLFELDIPAALLPDIAGYLFLRLGLRGLREERGSFGGLRRSCALLILISALMIVLALLCLEVQVNPWAAIVITKTALACYATRQTVRGVEDMEARYGCDMRAGRLLRLWKRYAALLILAAAASVPRMTAAWPPNYPGWVDGVFRAANVCLIVTVIETYRAFHVAGAQHAAIPAGAHVPSPGEQP